MIAREDPASITLSLSSSSWKTVPYIPQQKMKFATNKYEETSLSSTSFASPYHHCKAVEYSNLSNMPYGEETKEEACYDSYSMPEPAKPSNSSVFTQLFTDFYINNEIGDGKRLQRNTVELVLCGYFRRCHIDVVDQIKHKILAFCGDDIGTNNNSVLPTAERTELSDIECMFHDIDINAVLSAMDELQLNEQHTAHQQQQPPAPLQQQELRDNEANLSYSPPSYYPHCDGMDESKYSLLRSTDRTSMVATPTTASCYSYSPRGIVENSGYYNNCTPSPHCMPQRYDSSYSLTHSYSYSHSHSLTPTTHTNPNPAVVSSNTTANAANTGTNTATVTPFVFPIPPRFHNNSNKHSNYSNNTGRTHNACGQSSTHRPVANATTMTANPTTTTANNSNHNSNNNVNKKGLYRLSVEHIVEKQFSIEELVEYDLICRLIKDKNGSKYLQQTIKKIEHNECESVISVLIDYLINKRSDINLVAMSEDVYGNYLIQLLFSRGHKMHHKILLEHFVFKSILRLSRNKYGCRVIQHILHTVKVINYLIEMVQEFQIQCIREGKKKTSNANQSNSVLSQCLQCCNVNRVLQVMIELNLPFTVVEFIGNELERDLLHYAQETNACRVVQSFVKTYGDKLAVCKLLSNKSHLYLSEKVHGNYVIQCIIKKGEWYSELPVMKEFRNKLIYDIFEEKNLEHFSRNKHGSNVIEECIRVSSRNQISYLVNVLCRKQGYLLNSLMRNKFGNYIPKTLLDHCSKRQQSTIIRTIHQHIINLQHLHYSSFRHCSELILKCHQIKRQLDGYGLE
eukprot:CAMPEP_0197077032 /NCGR_PEP_ID=MMETSP1384-20130603/212414_1 /TAXON_ID=29189 /ORGANISM="Ammonia sp." /LENGTH=795 /DNA_ID=CAMNT_0042515891 /DNA_START=124 /DNA_END=2511 /DNA_ORIENTATION=+